MHGYNGTQAKYGNYAEKIWTIHAKTDKSFNYKTYKIKFKVGLIIFFFYRNAGYGKSVCEIFLIVVTFVHKLKDYVINID